MTDTQTQMPNSYEEDEISLLDILVALAESWKLLVFCPLLVGMLASGISFLLPNTYESVAIARLTEEEAALFHAAPVLDPLIEKFGYLESADGIREDARNVLKKDLTYTADKKTRLVTLVAKGNTPEQAQAMGRAAFGALFGELVPKGKEKEAILQEIAINNQLIADGVVYVDRSSGKQNSVAPATPATPATPAKSQVANLKLNNLELQLKLEARGGEVFAQEPSLPQRKSAPKHGLIFIIAILISAFIILLRIFVLNAWDAAMQNHVSASKLIAIKKNLKIK